MAWPQIQCTGPHPHCKIIGLPTGAKYGPPPSVSMCREPTYSVNCRGCNAVWAHLNLSTVSDAVLLHMVVVNSKVN